LTLRPGLQPVQDSHHQSAVAPDADIINEHARCGGFPAKKVTKLATMIDPATGAPETADIVA
jgi:hypothetical protein